MKLVSAKVFNFRATDSSGALLPLGRFTTLVGPNNAGKTSLILAVVGALYVVKGDYNRLQSLGPLLWSRDNLFQLWDDPVPSSAPSGCSLHIKFDSHEWRQTLSAFDEEQRASASDDLLDRLLSGVGMVWTVSFPEYVNDSVGGRGAQWQRELLGVARALDRKASLSAWRAAGIDIGSDQADGIFELLVRRDADWSWLSGFEVIYVEANRGGYVTQAGSSQRDIQYLEHFFPERNPGELVDLVKALNTVRRRHERSKFFSYVQTVLPDVRDVEVVTDDLGDHVYLTQGARKHPLYRSGNGVVNTLYLCARVLQSAHTSEPRGGIIFLDEPEVGLHPDLHRRLIRLAQMVYQDLGVQWVMATHSPYLLMHSLSDEDQALLVRLKDDRTDVQRVESSKDVAAVYDAVGLYLPSLLDAAGVIIVEGRTEQEFLSNVLPKVGIDLDALRVCLLPIGNTLLGVDPTAVARTHPNILMLLDSEKLDPADRLPPDREQYLTASGMRCFIDVTVRSIENSYPPQTLRRALETERSPVITPYMSRDELWEALRKAGPSNHKAPLIGNKLDLARCVGHLITSEEARQVSMVREIISWVESPESGRVT